ncbi:Galactosylgalactosylxylosylprotein 3-beta-glucuronosyltransferase S [Orchesella cincta]|uniref:Galactosylgalactosylxylosylprotein 3-beta-glucuronosyltransferase n=1 Tax=Orchesella cincta TaxID=48709 RepID=A0A1D2M6Z7_ORCCI|nr:Galactosylgalactosylxylosylprotein 3-beta-glucuronosyltransferase S [Orchesella cincta]
MKIINPLNIVDQYYYDDDNFLPAGDDPNAPLNRVFVTLKILLINLTFGCVITFLFFKFRNCISGCVSWFCCGNCDCDNDGYGRVPPPRRHRRPSRSKTKKMTANSTVDSDVDEDCCAQPAGDVTIICEKIIIFGTISKRLFWRKSVMSLVAGFVLAWMLIHVVAEEKLADPLVHSFSNPQLLSEKEADSRRVFFITPTAKSGVQIPRLIRLAQALYPNRDGVVWVLVSHDPRLFEPWNNLKLEHWNRGQRLSWSNNETKVLNHLEDLSEVLGRFGIPFVLLSAHDIHVSDEDLYSHRGPSVARLSTKFNKAGHIGITWVVKTYSDGVLLVGNEDAGYNFQLFREIQDTQIISSWPTAGFDYRYIVGLTTPVLYKNKPVPKGFFGGGTVRLGHIPLQYGSYALTVKFAKDVQTQSSNNLWKLTSHEEFTTADLNITAQDVEPMGKNCTEVYVWKLTSYFTFSRSINKLRIPLKYKEGWKNTNVARLVDQVIKWFELRHRLYRSKGDYNVS